MAEKITIAELDIDTNGLLQSATETKNALDSLRAEQTKLKKAGQQSTEEFVKNEVAIKKLSTQYNEQKKVLTALTDENKNFVKTEVAINKAVTKNVNTIDEARKNNKELLAVRNKLNLKTDEGRKQLERINNKLNDNNKFIKENVSGYEQQKIGIGDYEGALRRVFPQMNNVIDGLKATKNGLVAQKTALQSSTVATNTSSKALKLFRIALMSTGIGAIVVALGSLVTFLTSTQKGIDAVTKVTKPLQVIFQSLLGVVQNLGEDLFDAFSNPKQLLVDLVNFVQTNVLNRFKAFGVVLDGIKNFDLKKIGNGILQFGSGVEDVIGKIGDASKATSDFVGKAVDDGLRLRKIAIDIEQKEAELVLSRQKNRDLIAEQELIAKNTALTAEERNKAADEALRLSKELAAEEKELINLKIQEEEINQSLNDSGREDLKKLNELKAQAIAADTAQKKTELRFIGVKSAVEKQAQAEQKKAAEQRADDFIKAADAELELFIKTHQSKLDANTFFTEELLKQEQQRLDDIAEKEKENQLLRLEQGKISQTEYNAAIDAIDEENRTKKDEAQKVRDEAKKEKEVVDLENQRAIDEENFASDFEVKQERLEQEKEKEIEAAKKSGADIDLINTKFKQKELALEKEISDQKRKVTSDTFAAISGLVDQNSALGKTAALAQAGINVQEGITKAIAQGGIAGIATGAIVAAKGAQSISKIAGFDQGGKITTPQNIPTRSGGDNVLITAKRGEVILNEQQQARAGGAAFFDSIGVPGFNNGGVVGGLTSSVSAPIQQSGQSTTEFANVVANEINKVKIVAIESDITDAQVQQVEIVNGANF